jgi:predicted acetyltransferase
MLELRKINLADAEKEWEYISLAPEDENGLTNPNHGVSRDEFISTVLPGMIGYSEGINLPDGYVPETYFFLWNGDEIVGEFRIRHFLNDALREGAGHIGYGIKKELRNMGFATKGLAMAIEEAKKIIPEDDIYLRLRKTNTASLRVMLKNGAYIAHENEKEIFTRIKIK